LRRSGSPSPLSRTGLRSTSGDAQEPRCDGDDEPNEYGPNQERTIFLLLHDVPPCAPGTGATVAAAPWRGQGAAREVFSAFVAGSRSACSVAAPSGPRRASLGLWREYPRRPPFPHRRPTALCRQRFAMRSRSRWPRCAGLHRGQSSGVVVPRVDGRRRGLQDGVRAVESTLSSLEPRVGPVIAPRDGDLAATSSSFAAGQRQRRVCRTGCSRGGGGVRGRWRP